MGALSDEHERAVRVASVYGVLVEDRDCSDNAWDGRTIALRYGGRLRPVADIIHDLAHWLVCARSRRSLRDFGLGTGPDGGEGAERVVSARTANDEEARASLLGIAIQRDLGLGNWSAALLDHSWGSLLDPVGGHLRHLRWLHDRGFMRDGMAVPPEERVADAA